MLSKYRLLGTSKGLLSGGPLPTSPQGSVFFRVVFTFGLLSFLSLVSLILGHCNTSLEQPKYKKTKQINKQKQLLRHPKVISPAVMSPEIYS